MPTTTIFKPPPTSNKPAGNVPLPNRDFPVTNPRGPKTAAGRPQESAAGLFYNPYGGGDLNPSTTPWGFPIANRSSGNQGLAAVGAIDDHPIYGGKQDLLKSIATRGIAINQLQQLLGRTNNLQGETQPAMGAAAGFKGSGSPYLQSLLPGLNSEYQRDTALGDVNNRGTLYNLLLQLYGQGGSILGSATANTGSVVQLSNAEHARKINKIASGLSGIPYVGGLGAGVTTAVG